MNEFKRLWLRISPRERGLALGCGVLLIVSFCYYALWLPLQQQTEQWQRTVAREKNTVEWMSQQIPLLQLRKPQPIPGEEFNLSATVARSAVAQGINITHMHPQGERLAITLEPDDFNTLMNWLTQLEQQYRIHIVAFDVAAQPDKSGWVAVNKLILEQHDGR
jgi:general secretion pathway protein M